MKRVLPVVLLILLVGCKARLHDESDITVDADSIKYRTLDPIKNERKIKVSAKGKGLVVQARDGYYAAS